MQTMKVQKDALVRGLSVIMKAVGDRGTIPIIGNILMISDGDELKLGATNLEISIVCTVEVIEADEFRTTVPAKLFNELIGAIRSEEIEFVYNEESLVLKVKTEDSNNNIRCLDAVDFPDMPEFPENVTLAMPPETFRMIVLRSVFSAASSGSGLPIYTGTHFEAKDSELAIMSTDGFRYSIEKVPVKSADFSVTIPASYASEVSRTAEREVEIAVLEKSIMFHSGDVVAEILALGGLFPDLRNHVPEVENPIKVTANTVEMYKAAKHAAIFCEENKRTLKLEFSLLSKVSAQADQVGDSVVSFPVNISGEATTHLNADFLLNVLSVAGEKVKFSVGDATSPVLITLEGVENFLHVMMPINPG